MGAYQRCTSKINVHLKGVLKPFSVILTEGKKKLHNGYREYGEWQYVLITRRPMTLTTHNLCVPGGRIQQVPVDPHYTKGRQDAGSWPVPRLTKYEGQCHGLTTHCQPWQQDAPPREADAELQHWSNTSRTLLHNILIYAGVGLAIGVCFSTSDSSLYLFLSLRHNAPIHTRPLHSSGYRETVYSICLEHRVTLERNVQKWWEGWVKRV